MLRVSLRTMALLVASLGAARARADLLYVSNNSQNTGAVAITRIDTTTGVQTPFVTTLPGGNGGTEPLALDSSGNLYVGVQPNTGTPFIEKYTPAGVGSLYATLLPGTLSPSGLVFDGGGNLFVASFSGGGIEKVAPGGGPGSVSTFVPSSAVVNPTGLVISPLNGNLFTVNGVGVGAVQQITPGGVVSFFGNIGAISSQLAFDTLGNLYAPEASNSSRMDKITPGAVASLYATTGLFGGQGMAFDSAGNLYANALGSTSILKIAPNGTVSPFATLGSPSLAILQFLAVQPTGIAVVPEPGSLTLLGLGLSGLAAWAWRRRRAAGPG
jgi:hypothetical protein